MDEAAFVDGDSGNREASDQLLADLAANGMAVNWHRKDSRARAVG